jgi:hypothetical protein
LAINSVALNNLSAKALMGRWSRAKVAPSSNSRAASRVAATREGEVVRQPSRFPTPLDLRIDPELMNLLHQVLAELLVHHAVSFTGSGTSLPSMLYDSEAGLPG